MEFVSLFSWGRRFGRVPENAVVVRGVRAPLGATSKAAYGGHPVSVASNIPGAVALRLGNTQTEMECSAWREYHPEVTWLIPACGPWDERIYAEVRLATGETRRFAANVTNPTLPVRRYKYRSTEALGNPSFTWSQDFSTDAGRWMAYDYAPEGTHTFFPASHETRGGPEGGGYIWMDYSRTRRDTPDSNSFLLLINYSAWIEPVSRKGVYNHRSIDLGPKAGKPQVARFRLRSDCQNLYGGTYCFWVLGERGRIHKAGQPLEYGVMEWGPVQEVELSAPSQWTVTWGAWPDFGTIESFGISLLGATQKPDDRCRLSMGPITIGA